MTAPSFFNGAGPAAFQFYLQFADAGSPNYTWNSSEGASLESFIAQKTAMAFVYQSDLATIQTQAPFLDFGVTAAPQVSTNSVVNYPSYQGLAVWTGSSVKSWDWDFVNFATTNSILRRAILRPPATLRPCARSFPAKRQTRTWLFLPGPRSPRAPGRWGTMIV